MGNPIIYSVEKELMKRIYSVLETAQDKAIEVYNDHINRHEGHPMTKRNKSIMKIMEEDMNNVKKIIAELSGRFNCG